MLIVFHPVLVNLLGRLRQCGDGSMTLSLIPINAIHRSRGRLGPEWCSREELCKGYRGRGRNLCPHFVSVKPWLHLDIHTWAPFSWNRGYQESKSGSRLEL